MRTQTGRPTARTLWLLGAGYVLCWVVGLSLGGPDVAPGADAGEILDAHAPSTIALFALLVHGAAAGFLVALGVALAPSRRRRASIVLASTAAALSLLQLTGELVLVSAAGSADPVSVWTAITVADGAKMLVLAAWIGVVHGGRRAGAPAFTVPSGAAALALVVSGAGYLVRSPGLMTAAYVSLPLLLVWVLAAVRIQSRHDVENPQAVPSSV